MKFCKSNCFVSLNVMAAGNDMIPFNTAPVCIVNTGSVCFFSEFVVFGYDVFV